MSIWFSSGAHMQSPELNPSTVMLVPLLGGQVGKTRRGTLAALRTEVMPSRFKGVRPPTLRARAVVTSSSVACSDTWTRISLSAFDSSQRLSSASQSHISLRVGWIRSQSGPDRVLF